MQKNFDIALFKREKTYPELQKAHGALKDDWDNRVFERWHVPSLYRLLGKNDILYETAKKEAIQARTAFSRRYISDNRYQGVAEFIEDAKCKGHTVYIVTDANAVAAEYTLHWLGLDGKVDAVFCPRSAKRAYRFGTPRLHETPVVAFAPKVFKPDCTIIADILLHHAKREGLVPEEVKRGDTFQIRIDPQLPLHASLAVRNRLVIKKGKYYDALSDIAKNTILIGDDARDHIMGHNASIAIVKADYGKPDDNDPDVKRGKAILKAATGWSSKRLNLLLPIGGKSEVEKYIYPDFVCKKSLLEVAGWDNKNRQILTR